MTTTNTYGRQVVVPLTNKSGGGVIAGDVVVVDTTNNDAFTTSTAGAFTGTVGVAQETIASNATGRVLTSGYAALINTSASVTRGNFGKTHTVAKQAVDAGSSRVAGTFVQFLTGGTTPDGVVFQADLGAASGMTNPMTTKGDVILGDTSGTPSRLAAGTSAYVLTSNGAGAFPSWQVAAGGGITRSTLGTTSAGSSFLTTRGTYVKKITLASAGELSSIHAFVKGNSTYIEMTAVLYTDSSGPTNMLSVPVPSTTSGGVTLTSMELNTTVRDMSMPIGRWLVAGDYWIGINDYNGTAGLSLAYNSGTGGDYQLALADVPYDSSISAFSSTSNDWCIYADILR